MKEDQKDWEDRYKEKEFDPDQEASSILKKYLRLLPRGRALDLAAGEGRNAVFLAEHGFEVEAVDISREALSRARKMAGARGVKIRTIRADLDFYSIPKELFDLIIDFNFLDRKLIPRIKKGLKRGGVILFETYTVDQKNLGSGGPSKLKYLLKPNELLHLFQNFRVLYYREGVFREGGTQKAIATLIAKKVFPSRDKSKVQG